MGDRDRYRPPSMRVVPVETPQGVPSLAPGLLPAVVKSLPPWGRVVVGAALAIGLGSGAGLASAVKLMGIQTVTQATADKVELQASIAGVVKAQQTSDALAATSRTEMLASIEAIRKSTMTTNAKLQAIGRQLGQKRAPKSAAPKEEETQ